MKVDHEDHEDHAVAMSRFSWSRSLNFSILFTVSRQMMEMEMKMM